MALEINWPTFDKKTMEEYRAQLTKIMNQGPFPPQICDAITVTELDVGKIPPSVQIVEVGDMSSKSFEATVNIHYMGDFKIGLLTKVQINAYTPSCGATRRLNSHLGILDVCASPMVMPLSLKISEVSVKGTVHIKAQDADGKKELTAYFAEDPLQSVKVESSFDEFAPVRAYLQKEVEGFMRVFFVEDFPKLISQVSKTMAV